MSDALRVVANLATPLAGDPPQLDSLLTFVMARLLGKDAEPGYKMDRNLPCPESGKIPIALERLTSYGANMTLSSSPIMDDPMHDGVEYVAKRISVEHCGLLGEKERLVVATTNNWTKSYRLPLRIRRVAKVVWLCVGNRRGILKALRYVPAIGKKVSNGYGQVSSWECERTGAAPTRHWPWWIDSNGGPVLMRPIPLEAVVPGLIGWRQDYGACIDPYWHPERYREIAVPC